MKRKIKLNYSLPKVILLGLYQYGWGLGIGDWGLGIGDWAQSPILNPQSPIPQYYIHDIQQINSHLYKNTVKILIILLTF